MTPPGDIQPPTLTSLTRQVIAFRDARDWKQFHNPKDLALSIVLEAAELLEIFQWKADDNAVRERATQRKDDVADELADILYYTLLMAEDLGIDLSAALMSKLDKNDKKYPVDKSKGSSRKYTEL